MIWNSSSVGLRIFFLHNLYALGIFLYLSILKAREWYVIINLESSSLCVQSLKFKYSSDIIKKGDWYCIFVLHAILVYVPMETRIWDFLKFAMAWMLKVYILVGFYVWIWIINIIIMQYNELSRGKNNEERGSVCWKKMWSCKHGKENKASIAIGFLKRWKVEF